MGIFDRFKKRTSRRTAEEQLEAAFSYANERDFEKALTLMTRASERGLAEAQARFGVILVTGSDVKKDLPQAIEWFRRAAIQGHPLALWKRGN